MGFLRIVWTLIIVLSTILGLILGLLEFSAAIGISNYDPEISKIPSLLPDKAENTSLWVLCMLGVTVTILGPLFALVAVTLFQLADEAGINITGAIYGSYLDDSIKGDIALCTWLIVFALALLVIFLSFWDPFALSGGYATPTPVP